MGSETHENGDAAVSLTHDKAAHRAYGFIIYRQGNHIAM